MMGRSLNVASDNDCCSAILLKNATMWVKWFSDLDGNGAG
jgi:hypothetical protein